MITNSNKYLLDVSIILVDTDVSSRDDADVISSVRDILLEVVFSIVDTFTDVSSCSVKDTKAVVYVFSVLTNIILFFCYC